MGRRCLSALALLLISSAAYAWVFDFRPPTPQERKALERFSRVIDQVLAQFKDADWEENVDRSLADVEVNPNSEYPLHLNTFVQRTYDVRGSSDRYKEQVLPLVKEMVQSSDLEQKKELNRQIQDLMHVQVRVRLNQPHIAVIPKPEENHDLQIPGSALAYKTKNEDYSSGSAYVLLFGDVHALQWNPEHNWFDYNFVHAANTPVIENVEFRIYGAEDRIQELLQSIDWQQVNNALTPAQLSPAPTDSAIPQN
ncbi:MAG TPA: hypothetical protein VJV96_13790 [Candidatus Angelobacter sp.]|nr:hypothetical protein [Candidatus Angelobacter sp.]